MCTRSRQERDTERRSRSEPRPRRLFEGAPAQTRPAPARGPYRTIRAVFRPTRSKRPPACRTARHRGNRCDGLRPASIMAPSTPSGLAINAVDVSSRSDKQMAECSGGSVIARPASGFSDPRTVGFAERKAAAAIADADRVYEPGGRSAYHFAFSVELRTPCTTDWDIRKVRAMAAGLTPALNDARMRFAVPSGML
jgi:hypothetical protein